MPDLVALGTCRPDALPYTTPDLEELPNATRWKKIKQKGTMKKTMWDQGPQCPAGFRDGVPAPDSHACRLDSECHPRPLPFLKKPQTLPWSDSEPHGTCIPLRRKAGSGSITVTSGASPGSGHCCQPCVAPSPHAFGVPCSSGLVEEWRGLVRPGKEGEVIFFRNPKRIAPKQVTLPERVLLCAAAASRGHSAGRSSARHSVGCCFMVDLVQLFSSLISRLGDSWHPGVEFVCTGLGQVTETLNLGARTRQVPSRRTNSPAFRSEAL